MSTKLVDAVRRLSLLAAAFLIFVLPLAGQPKQITILHTNDMHASFLPHEAFWVRQNPKPLVGGFNELAFAIDSIRKIRSSTLVLDAGDLMTGNPITDRVYHGAEGGALVEMLNLIGYEGWTPGNHDFDVSYANFQKLAAIGNFAVVAANLIDKKTGMPVTGREYVIIEKNGLKIGIFGLISKEFYNLVDRNSTRQVQLLSPIQTAKRLVGVLRSKADLVVALSHQGVDDDSLLAANVKGLDVIVGGHSHTRLTKPMLVSGVIIVQTGINCENLGVLDLTVDHGTVMKWNGELHQLWYHPNRKTVVKALVDSFKTEIDKEYSEVIGTMEGAPGAAESGAAIANFIADALREGAKADISFINSGGIRKKLTPGVISKRALYELLPFRNKLTTFKITGEQLSTIVRYIIANKPGVYVSGVDCEWRVAANGTTEIVRLLVQGNPINENASYKGTADDYVMGEAKRYLGIDTPPLTYMNETVCTVVEKRVRAERTVSAKIEGRIREIK
jgi:2',3'-cyclic-nucleotide 2'-phosphodiesterase (5'-nucleotidase family)